MEKYKGKGWNHTIGELEQMVIDRDDLIMHLQSEIKDYRETLNHYANRMDSGGAARRILKEYELEAQC